MFLVNYKSVAVKYRAFLLPFALIYKNISKIITRCNPFKIKENKNS